MKKILKNVLKDKNLVKTGIGIVMVLVLLIIFHYFLTSSSSESKIYQLTDNWINAVTIKNDPSKVASLFCDDGNLVGTVSQTIRTGKAIEQYFDYFAKLPKIAVLHKKYDIVKVANNVYLNTAFITWYWDGLDKPIVARMSFLFRDNCIFQLHSSALPELNKNLKKSS